MGHRHIGIRKPEDKRTPSVVELELLELFRTTISSNVPFDVYKRVLNAVRQYGEYEFGRGYLTGTKEGDRVY